MVVDDQISGQGLLLWQVVQLQGPAAPTLPIGSGSSFQASSFEGQWNTTGKDLRTGTVFTDVTGAKEVTVQPVEDQGSWESRALWLKVAKGI
jgi:hypothetical protein